MANKILGAKLKALRLKNGMTQKDVYETLCISQSTFSSWEIGKSEPDAMTFLHLCELYNVPDVLYEFTGKSLQTKEEPKSNTAYTRLNALGRRKADEYISDLADNPKYTTQEKSAADVSAFDSALDITPYPAYARAEAAHSRMDT